MAGCGAAHQAATSTSTTTTVTAAKQSPAKAACLPSALHTVAEENGVGASQDDDYTTSSCAGGWVAAETAHGAAGGVALFQMASGVFTYRGTWMESAARAGAAGIPPALAAQLLDSQT